MTSSNGGKLVLLGCGDVGPVHEPLDVLSSLVRPVLAEASVRFSLRKACEGGGFGFERGLRRHLIPVSVQESP